MENSFSVNYIENGKKHDGGIKEGQIRARHRHAPTL